MCVLAKERGLFGKSLDLCTMGFLSSKKCAKKNTVLVKVLRKFVLVQVHLKWFRVLPTPTSVIGFVTPLRSPSSSSLPASHSGSLLVIMIEVIVVFLVSYIYTHTHTCMYVCVYIYIERERDRQI